MFVIFAVYIHKTPELVTQEIKNRKNGHRQKTFLVQSRFRKSSANCLSIEDFILNIQKRVFDIKYAREIELHSNGNYSKD